MKLVRSKCTKTNLDMLFKRRERLKLSSFFAQITMTLMGKLS